MPSFAGYATMPSWLHGFARNQPCTPVIEAIRALLAGDPVGVYAGRATAWCVGILIVSALASMALFRRRTH